MVVPPHPTPIPIEVMTLFFLSFFPRQLVPPEYEDLFLGEDFCWCGGGGGGGCQLKMLVPLYENPRPPPPPTAPLLEKS